MAQPQPFPLLRLSLEGLRNIRCLIFLPQSCHKSLLLKRATLHLFILGKLCHRLLPILPLLHHPLYNTLASLLYLVSDRSWHLELLVTAILPATTQVQLQPWMCCRPKLRLRDIPELESVHKPCRVSSRCHPGLRGAKVGGVPQSLHVEFGCPIY